MPFLTVLLSATVHLSVASPVVDGVVDLKAFTPGGNPQPNPYPGCLFPTCK
ncbi:hypothetical protein PtA15_6A449 [Puccinia triticina]|nr:uncharacterized protein PtA15_6A449 [Puccinia triticina]WAQ85820.1 hypothetical protein PtA15_6A449 [Puccinia triticina]